MEPEQRVRALRQYMKTHNFTAYVVPSEDAHMSEYVAKCDQRRAFISGFTGSAGTALITMNEAYCWTDGRYFVQAANELDRNVFTLMKLHEDPPIEEWIPDNLPTNSVVGIDATTISINAIKSFTNAISTHTKTHGISLRTLYGVGTNLVDLVWGESRPPTPRSNIFVHPLQFAGASVKSKLATVRARMLEKEVAMLVVTALDEIAWLLNLRAADVDYNPVFWSYVTVTAENANLYVDDSRFGEHVAQQLERNKVSVRPYDMILKDLQHVNLHNNAKVWLDPTTCNYAILCCLNKSPLSLSFLKKQGPIPLLKAAKNEVELRGTRSAHIRDAIALVKYLCWLEDQVVNKGNELTECEAADKIDALRAAQEQFVSLSFPTISSVGANCAVIHYRPERATCATITADKMYLVDSGAQYRDGTTDVTRTVHFGKPSAWERECFTRVLAGHIAIDTAIFPKGTTGHILDSLARQPLWKGGLDYKHGTGHGVGSFLNVHEGPHMLSSKTQALGTALEPGFLSSNEPGYYEESKFGIRIENICVVTKANLNTPLAKEIPLYKMEHVTFAPLQAKLIDPTLLTPLERKWVDDYHAECFEKLSPLLKDDPNTFEWLRVNTKPLSVQLGIKL